MGAMAVTRTKAEEFQRLAQECRATAQTLSTEQARAEMLAMADVCDRVAAQPTHGNDVSEAGAPASTQPAQYTTLARLGDGVSRVSNVGHSAAAVERAVTFQLAKLE